MDWKEIGGDTGLCTGCLETPNRLKIFTCGLCNKKYHALCEATLPSMGSKTFVDTYLRTTISGNATKNFKWFCDLCDDKLISCRSNTLSTLFEKVDDMSKKSEHKYKQLAADNVGQQHLMDTINGRIDDLCDKIEQLPTLSEKVNDMNNQTGVSFVAIDMMSRTMDDLRDKLEQLNTSKLLY